MLSFFRSKSIEAQVNEIKTATQNLKMQSPASSSTNTPNTITEQDASALVISLGYKDTTELKETIYGYCSIFICAN